MAKFNRGWRSLVPLALAVTAGVAFATWRAGEPVQAAEVPRLKAGEIVDAVLFNDGPAARYLTGLRRGPTEWDEEVRKLQREVKAAVEKDPAFAATFVAQMQSGNPRSTAAAMSRLGMVVRAELDSMYGTRAVDEAIAKLDQAFGEQRLVSVQDQAAVQNNEFSYDNGNDVWLAVDVVVVASAVAVVAVLVVASAIDFTPREYSDRTMLAHEVFINRLATDLRGPR
jgi:SdpC family antimicrobial peptide